MPAAPPKVAAEYKEGHAKLLESWNNTVTNNKSLKQIQDASENFDVDGNANTLYNNIMTSGPDGAAPNYDQKMDMIFGDVSGSCNLKLGAKIFDKCCKLPLRFPNGGCSKISRIKKTKNPKIVSLNSTADKWYNRLTEQF